LTLPLPFFLPSFVSASLIFFSWFRSGRSAEREKSSGCPPSSFFSFSSPTLRPPLTIGGRVSEKQYFAAIRRSFPPPSSSPPFFPAPPQEKKRNKLTQRTSLPFFLVFPVPPNAHEQRQRELGHNYKTVFPPPLFSLFAEGDMGGVEYSSLFLFPLLFPPFFPHPRLFFSVLQRERSRFGIR